MRALRAILIGAALLSSGPEAATQAAGFVVVVNAANPVTAVTREEASRLFLKKTDRWADGGTVAPVDLPDGSPTRQAFSKAVHNRSMSAIKAYWQQQVFAAKGIPPMEKESDAEVLAFVRGDPHAIGYVSASAPLGAGVKRVDIRR